MKPEPKKRVGRPRKSQAFTQSQKIDELWRRGVIAPFKLHETQKKMYKQFHESTSKKFVFNCSRRLGKSYALCVIAIEEAIKNPGSQIRFLCPTQRMVKKIMIPTFRIIMSNCPTEMRPRLNKVDGVWQFPNGSEIHICGSEQGQVDGLRGTAANLILIDEAGFCSDLEYALESVLMPQTLTVKNARIILASTPPPSPDHPFLKYVQQAQADNAYAKYTIFDNPMLTPDTIAEYMKEAGGENSTTWRREYMSEFCTDQDSAVIPEATPELLRQIVIEHVGPKFFIPFTAIDLGYVDNTGVVFGYHDFTTAKTIIQRDLLINRKTSQEIVKLVKGIEMSLWGREPLGRVVDGNPMQLADLNSIHNFNAFVPQKSDLQANVNRLRLELAEQRLIIDPSCTRLIEQLQYATWDATKSKFSRSATNGHWDLIAALIYFLARVDRNTNPFPVGFGWDLANSWGVETRRLSAASNVFQSMFPTLRGK